MICLVIYIMVCSNIHLDIASSFFSIPFVRQASAVAPAAALPMFRCTQSPPTVRPVQVRVGEQLGLSIGITMHNYRNNLRKWEKWI